MLYRRYPGVSPFTSEQQNIFFGRDNDIKKLYKLISMRKQVLLYAKSGIGKTSLLNAGVLPKLADNFVIIKIRFFAYNEQNSLSPTDKTLNVLQAAIPSEPNENLNRLIAQTQYKKTLWYYFKLLQLSGKQKFILVFDQFEELFSYPQAEIDRFKSELHELTNIDIPDELKQQIAKDDNADDEFVETLYEDLNIKTVFAIRSDRLSLLNLLADKIPDIQETFYELKPLDEEQAKMAIVQPATNKSDFQTKPFELNRAAIEKIMSTLTKNGKENVESTQLQIVCQRIEDIAQQKYAHTLNNETVTVAENDLPEFKDIFRSFYNDTVNAVTNIENERIMVRKFIEDQLIRNRQRISLDEIICTDFITKNILQQLVGQHLLRAERNTTGGFSYELSHDTLIEPIQEAAEERRLREEKEKNEFQRQEELRKLREQRKRQRKIIFIVSIAAIFSIGFAIFGLWQKNIAEKEKQKATQMYDQLQEQQYSLFKSEGDKFLNANKFQEAIKQYSNARNIIADKNTAAIDSLINRCNKFALSEEKYYNLFNQGKKLFDEARQAFNDSFYPEAADNYIAAYQLFAQATEIDFPDTAAKQYLKELPPLMLNLADKMVEISKRFSPSDAAMFRNKANQLRTIANQ